MGSLHLICTIAHNVHLEFVIPPILLWWKGMGFVNWTVVKSKFEMPNGRKELILYNKLVCENIMLCLQYR